MDELTGSIFRTYHASHALQQQLDELTPTNGTVDEKLSAYRSANNAVAMLFNHLHKTSELTTRDKSSESLLDNSKQQEDAIKLTCLDPRISVAWYAFNYKSIVAIENELNYLCNMVCIKKS